METRFTKIPVIILACSLAACNNNPIDYYIVGTVTDALTGEPITGVTVETGHSYNAVTGADGRYRIHNRGEVIVALKPGYETHYVSRHDLHINYAEPVRYDIELNPGGVSEAVPPSPLTSGVFSHHGISISWQPPSDSSDIAGYILYRKDTPIRTTHLNGAGDSSPIPGELNCYSVVSFNSAGNESIRSVEACVNPSACPNDINLGITYGGLEVISDTEIKLNWSPRGSDRSKVHTINLYRDGIWLSAQDGYEYESLSYIDNWLSPASEHCYAITSIDNGMETDLCRDICISTWPE